jgi:protein-tyrosine phosphatase
MVVQPYWINTRLAIIPRPRGPELLDGEMLAIAKAAVNVVVSLLPESEASELGLAREEEAATQAGLRFLSFPIRDRGVPDDVAQFHALLANLAEMMAAGQRVGIHCRACVGRASVVAVSLLIRSGLPAEKAWQKVEAARQFPVPDTKEQREWVDRSIGPAA